MVSRKDLLRRPVKDMRLRKGMGISELIDQMECSGGFTARNLAIGARILKDMLRDEESVNFLSFPACVVATGTRGVLAQAVKEFDVLMTTCGTLDHDLARAWGGRYYHGGFMMDDSMLHRKRINRLGNVLIPNESYGQPLEDRMQNILEDLAREKEEWGGRELIHEFGKRIRDRGSIIYQAAKHGVPVYVPGIFDGAFGTQLMIFAQDHRFRINLLKDEKELSDIVFDARRTGALMIGGGISKHHTIWWNQFRGGLDRAVYITTAVEYDGSLSGARLREAVSWGKVKERARYITIDGDATVLLPLLLATALW